MFRPVLQPRVIPSLEVLIEEPLAPEFPDHPGNQTAALLLRIATDTLEGLYWDLIYIEAAEEKEEETKVAAAEKAAEKKAAKIAAVKAARKALEEASQTEAEKAARKVEDAAEKAEDAAAEKEALKHSNPLIKAKRKMLDASINAYNKAAKSLSHLVCNNDFKDESEEELEQFKQDLRCFTTAMHDARRVLRTVFPSESCSLESEDDNRDFNAHIEKAIRNEDKRSNPLNPIEALRMSADKIQGGKTSFGAKLGGALLAMAGAASFVISLGFGFAIGLPIIIGGITLFSSGFRSGFPKHLHELADAAEKYKQVSSSPKRNSRD